MKTSFVLGTGLLFGLGINWFAGVWVAVYARSIVRWYTARAAVRFWPLVLAATMALWSTERVPLQCIDLLCGLAFTMMLVRFLVADGPERRPRAEPNWLAAPAQVLGQSSYPTYLFHGPILILVGAAIRAWHLSLDWRLTWLVSSVVAIACGVALGFGAEKPIMAWRGALLNRMKVSHAEPRGHVARPVLNVATEARA
jgi:peptidoglycan/LPS O-acetylase OafA/YrhL